MKLYSELCLQILTPMESESAYKASDYKIQVSSLISIEYCNKIHKSGSNKNGEHYAQKKVILESTLRNQLMENKTKNRIIHLIDLRKKKLKTFETGPANSDAYWIGIHVRSK